jgi:hypothetical protein
LAAPFPLLPSKRELIEASSLLTAELAAVTRKLQSLEIERSRLCGSPRNRVIRSFRLDDFRGFLFCCDVTDELRGQNQSKIEQSHRLYSVQSAPQVSIVEELPFYQENMQRHVEALSFVFTSIFWRAAVVHDQKMSFASQYVQIYRMWKTEFCPAVDTLNLKYHRDMRVDWGEEQAQQPTVPFEGPDAKAGVVCDIEQRLRTEIPRYWDYYDTNRFVQDPIYAHIQYKRRLAWTEEERELFLRLFWAHPHEFARIAESFPDKTTKDIVEFYYLTKTSHQMVAAKGMKKKRVGAKAKRLTEGKVART